MNYKFNEGVYYIDKPFLLSNDNYLISEGKTTFKIDANYKYDCFVDARNSNSIGKIRIENIKFDATECNKYVKGIIFNQIIYNNIFRNLEFESLRDSWFYNDSNCISEHIEFSMIQGNCRNNIYVNPLIKLDRINESNFIGCKIYGKQYHNEPYSNIPIMKLDTPQNVNIFGCSFHNTNGIAINVINTKDSRIRGININNCAFEDCRNEDTIKIVGSDKWYGEYGSIKNNSYTERPGNIYLDNYYCLDVEDYKASVLLEKGTRVNVVKKFLDNGTFIIDRSKKNKIIIY